MKSFIFPFRDLVVALLRQALVPQSGLEILLEENVTIIRIAVCDRIPTLKFDAGPLIVQYKQKHGIQTSQQCGDSVQKQNCIPLIFSASAAIAAVTQ